MKAVTANAATIVTQTPIGTDIKKDAMATTTAWAKTSFVFRFLSRTIVGASNDPCLEL